MKILQVDLPSSEAWAAGLSHLLSPDERERARRYRFERDRSRFVVSRVALRSALSAWLSVEPEEIVFDNRCRRCSKAHGKPSVVGAGPPFDFSLSRSGDLALIGIGTVGPLGVDVERVDTTVVTAEVVRSALSENEAADLPSNGCERAQRFFRSWARKEAYAKATGYGLGIPLPDINFVPGGEDDFVVASGRRGFAGRVRDLEPRLGYVAAVGQLDVELGPVRPEEGMFIPSC